MDPDVAFQSQIINRESQIDFMTELKDIAVDIVSRAMAGGATAADAIVREGNEFSTSVRLGDVETLKEAGSRAVGVRVFRGKRVGSTYSTDFSPQGLQQMLDGALELAKVTSEDPNAGMPEPSELGQLSGDLDLYHEDVYSLPPQERIEWARRAEKASMSADPRITGSDGAGFGATTGHMVLANSHGFVGEYRRSFCSVVSIPVATGEDGAMQRDYWDSVSRSFSKLESPEAVGRVAAQRTLRRLGARKIKTARVPIVFDPITAQALLDHMIDAVNGGAIYRSASFLAGKLGEQVAGENITMIDDGTMTGGFGTSPFDGEGVASRRTVVVEKGVLKSYLLNTYAARKLGLKTTGNASRGVTGNPGIGCGNFFLQPGERSPQDIIRDIDGGLYVIDFLGSGMNLVTGDFSRGATGIWISKGELTYPVDEITVAGNFQDMWRNVTAIGSDLEFRGSVACPTIRIDGMTVAGE